MYEYNPSKIRLLTWRRKFVRVVFMIKKLLNKLSKKSLVAQVLMLIGFLFSNPSSIWLKILCTLGWSYAGVVGLKWGGKTKNHFGGGFINESL